MAGEAEGDWKGVGIMSMPVTGEWWGTCVIAAFLERSHRLENCSESDNCSIDER